MSIIVENLTKKYFSQSALNNISFSAEKGKITGFLGPNGAGKSTTMKIATGFIPPSAGTVYVSGVDVLKSPLKVKGMTGYLPEHNPLYLDMYVKEYLVFIGAAYKLKKIKGKVEKVIDLVGLTHEQRKKIRALSKGYRQRVGLAQALIHDPEVLILDEPTTGLDPNQLVEIRKVIKHVSEDKTVILSTHIMQEVEALCDEVVIINKGKIVANDRVDHLKASGQSDVIAYKVTFEHEIELSFFKSFQVQKVESLTYSISKGSGDPRKDIMKIVVEEELPLVNISKQEQSLEVIFQQLTKEA